MTDDPKRITPDGKPNGERKTGDEPARGSVETDVQDPGITGDVEKPGYSNTDEARPDGDGLVRNPADQPLI